VIHGSLKRSCEFLAVGCEQKTYVMTKDEKEVEIKKLKQERKVLLRNLSRIVKAKQTKSVNVTLNRAFKIIQIAIMMRMIH